MSFVPEKDWKEEQAKKSEVHLGEKDLQLYTRKWEGIDDYTERLKVPNGWIVRSKVRYCNPSENCGSESMCFVPDPTHEWRLEDEQ